MNRLGVQRDVVVLAFSAAAVGIAMSAWLLRFGVRMTPDSWAYWQGAVSLGEGRGYRYFFGDLIIAHWPPLYSLYLAAWQAVLGVSGLSLYISNIALVGLATAGWVVAWVGPLRAAGTLPSGWRGRTLCGCLGLYFAAYMAVHTPTLQSEALRFALLPGLLLMMWRAVSADTARGFATWVAGTVVAASSLMLAHNANVAFVGASAAIIVAHSQVGWLRRLAGASAVASIPVLLWWMTREALGQEGSHLVGLGVSKDLPTEYAWQLLTGTAYLIGPNRFRLSLGVLGIFLGVLAISLVPWSRRRWVTHTDTARHAVVYLAFGVIATVLLWLLFSLTWVHEPLTGRFILYIPPLFVPAAILLWKDARARWLFAALTLGLSLQPVARYLGTQGEAPPDYPHNVQHGDILSRETPRPPHRLEPGQRLVYPPLYPWIRDSLEARGLPY